MKVKITNIHFRFEDQVGGGRGFKNQASPYSWGIKLKELILTTIDPNKGLKRRGEEEEENFVFNRK